jgi:hypothetical protein
MFREGSVEQYSEVLGGLPSVCVNGLGWRKYFKGKDYCEQRCRVSSLSREGNVSVAKTHGC